jgi:hypothetical protein
MGGNADDFGIFDARDLKVESSVVLGQSRVGGLVGETYFHMIRNVMVMETTVTGETGEVGGIIGANKGPTLLENAVFLSTLEKSPVSMSGGPADTIGGIAGTDDFGSMGGPSFSFGLKNILYLAVAPEDTSGNPVPFVAVQSSGDFENLFYLSGQGYNETEKDTNGEPFTTTEVAKIFEDLLGDPDPEKEPDNLIWVKRAYDVDKDLQKELYNAYPYPVLSKFGIPDRWPETFPDKTFTVVTKLKPEEERAIAPKYAPAAAEPSQGDVSPMDNGQLAGDNQEDETTERDTPEGVALAAVPALFLFGRRKGKSEL